MPPARAASARSAARNRVVASALTLAMVAWLVWQDARRLPTPGGAGTPRSSPTPRRLSDEASDTRRLGDDGAPPPPAGATHAHRAPHGGHAHGGRDGWFRRGLCVNGIPHNGACCPKTCKVCAAHACDGGGGCCRSSMGGKMCEAPGDVGCLLETHDGAARPRSRTAAAAPSGPRPPPAGPKLFPAPPRPPPGTSRRFLLFTSAGDRNNVGAWLGDPATRTYDVAVVYYADTAFNHTVDMLFSRKDTKFPNMKWYLATHAVDQYDAVAVWDDDIVVRKPEDIDGMFAEFAAHEASVFSPCHVVHPGVYTFADMKKSTASGIRRTARVEMNSPMFKPEFLRAWLDDFDADLKGWGTDIWYSNFCAARPGCSIAVSDTACVENPKRQGVREIVKAVGSNAERDRIWHQLARKNRQKVNWPRLQDFHFRAARRRLRAARRRFLRAVAP